MGPSFSKRDATVPVNQNWRAQGDARVASNSAPDSTWWKGFNDPALDRLVEMAYRQNLPLQVAGLKIVEARAQLGIAIGSQYPQQQRFFGRAAAVGVSRNGRSEGRTVSETEGVGMSFQLSIRYRKSSWNRLQHGVYPD